MLIPMIVRQIYVLAETLDHMEIPLSLSKLPSIGDLRRSDAAYIATSLRLCHMQG